MLGAGDRDRTGMASLEVLPLLIYFVLIFAHLGSDQRFNSSRLTSICKHSQAFTLSNHAAIARYCTKYFGEALTSIYLKFRV